MLTVVRMPKITNALNIFQGCFGDVLGTRINVRNWFSIDSDNDEEIIPQETSEEIDNQELPENTSDEISVENTKSESDNNEEKTW